MHRGTLAPALALALAIVSLLGLAMPSVITWLYFVRLAEAAPPWPHAAYAGGKLIQFSLPVVWWILGGRGLWAGFDPGPRAGLGSDPGPRAGLGSDPGPRAGSGSEPAPGSRPRSRSRVRSAHLAEGAASGIAMAALGATAAHFWLEPSGMLAPLVEAAAGRMAAFGIAGPAAFAAFGAAYAILHSGLEEWYWRGFAQSGLERLLPRRTAALGAALAFSAHHLVILAAFFGELSALVLLLAACVAAGGLIWSAMRSRHGHLYGAWLSHGLVDAAIFALGWSLTGGA